MKITVSPFTVLVDTREVTPWTFRNIPGYKGQGRIVVKTEWKCLGNGLGDYTIKGAVSKESVWRISLERKSISDLYSTILSNRERFVRELENLNKMEYAAVIVEAELRHVFSYSPKYWETFSVSTRLNYRRSLLGSIQAWQLRYPTIRWWFLPRKYAEIWAYRILHRFWEDRIK